MAHDRPKPHRELLDQIDITREIVRKAAELLHGSSPDSFCGRKTHEPFPWEADALEGCIEPGDLKQPT